jgi:hypothetical protein
MPRLDIVTAREMWGKVIGQKKWQGSVLEKVMFDWPKGEPTRYHDAAPAFYSIADESDTVDEQEYLKLQAELIRRGEYRSNLGRKRHSANPTPTADFKPSAIAIADIVRTMETVMRTVHPVVVRQEQILRCALIAHLPESIRQAIGTNRANVHPEMPTPSKEYQRKGSRKLRARIDVGFGHPTACDAVVAVLELKALTSFNDAWFKSQADKLNSTPPGLMFSGLAGDFEKLLDPKLPTNVFRCSWAVTKRRASANTEHIASWAQLLLKPVEQRLALTGFKQDYDPSTQWLRWRWAEGPTLLLAWYWPKEDAQEFESVWSNVVSAAD